MAIQFSGIGSGNDFSSLISSLVKAERAPISGLEQRRAEASRRIQLLSDLGSRLRALGQKAEAANSPDELRGVSGTSTDASAVGVAAAAAGASPGAWTISVSALAEASVHRSRGFASDSVGVLGAGAVGVAVGAGAFVEFSYDETDSLTTLAARINAGEAGVSASVVFDGAEHRLVLAGEETGAARALTFDDPGDALGLNLAGSQLVAARDAELTVAGLPIRRAKNTVDDAIAGVTLTLEKVTSEPVRVEVAADPSNARSKVQGLVDAFNDVARFVGAQLGTASKTSLFGDPTVRNLQLRMGRAVAQPFGGGTTLSTFGLELGRDGTLSLDAAELEAAAKRDPAALEAAIGGPEGLAAALSSLVDEYVTSGTGLLAARRTGLESRVRAYGESIDRIERRAGDYESRLRGQFAALDRVMSSLNSQTSYLAGLFIQR